MMKKRRKVNKKKGSALLISFAVLILLAVAGSNYLNSATLSMRLSKRQTIAVQTSDLCEAAKEQVVWALWRPFKVNQDWDDMDLACDGASEAAPKGSQQGTLTGIGDYSGAVIKYTKSGNYQRDLVVRAVGYVDRDNDDVLDADEPRRMVDVNVSFKLTRSAVFDYTYFVNNYGWMDGFDQNNLVINGDVRANGNFDFLNGTPTVNGSVIASLNEKLSPVAAGRINAAPMKWSNSTYSSNQSSNSRMRQAYSASVHGTKGTDTYESWRDLVFESDASIVKSKPDGAILFDNTGIDAWTNTSGTATTSLLDTTPSKELIMPDLSDLSKYQTLSQGYVDNRATFGDGSTNPDFGKGAYVQTWDSSQNKYVTVSTNGVVTGSAILIGTSDKPIKIHGPVTFTQDAVIKGTVQGQGTVYAGRNVHIVGSIVYKNAPDFRGSNQQTIDNNNSSKDLIALCARGSVMMGSPGSFENPYPLKYMTPPFTKGRYDEQGNWIPPFNALQTDSTGRYRYQSVYSDSTLANIASSINQLDCVIYTNFVGGGQLATGGSGMTFNGSIICKDEAMVLYSLPMRMNYDNRIMERNLTKQPLIDLQLPRSPVVVQNTWQDRGFSAEGY